VASRRMRRGRRNGKHDDRLGLPRIKRKVPKRFVPIAACDQYLLNTSLNVVQEIHDVYALFIRKAQGELPRFGLSTHKSERRLGMVVLSQAAPVAMLEPGDYCVVEHKIGSLMLLPDMDARIAFEANPRLVNESFVHNAP
jgi:hypothetical protein